MALVGIRTVNAVKINFTFVDWYDVSSMSVIPTGGELDIYLSEFIDGSKLHLDPPEFTILIRRHIERAVLGSRHENRKPLLE
jgi:hypothetical protein